MAAKQSGARKFNLAERVGPQSSPAERWQNEHTARFCARAGSRVEEAASRSVVTRLPGYRRRLLTACPARRSFHHHACLQRLAATRPSLCPTSTLRSFPRSSSTAASTSWQRRRTSTARWAMLHWQAATWLQQGVRGLWSHLLHSIHSLPQYPHPRGFGPVT